MNTERLHKILSETTVQLRKGEVVTGTPELVEEFKSLKPDDELKGGAVCIAPWAEGPCPRLHGSSPPCQGRSDIQRSSVPRNRGSPLRGRDSASGMGK